MEAIEFIAQAEDGIIKIPKKYLKNLPEEFRIIILISDSESTRQKSSKKRQFSAAKIKTKGLSLDREEANKR